MASHGEIAGAVERIDVHEDRLAVRVRSEESPGTAKPADDTADQIDDRSLFIPRQKPLSNGFGKSCCPMASREERSGRSDPNAAFDS